MKKIDKRTLQYFVYAIIIFAIFGILAFSSHFSVFQDFMTKVENSSFDLRQKIICKYKKANKDIVILAVDDQTYEYIMDKYGSWPISRRIWSDSIEAIERVNPRYIIFDLLFIKPNLNDYDSDLALVQSLKNHKNVFIAMSFDNYPDDVRKSPQLEDKLQLKIAQGKLEDNQYVTFTNCRKVMQEITDVTKNIGIINAHRDSDGIIRDVTPIFKYKNNYYPNLSLAVATDMFKTNSVKIDKNNIIINDEYKIPLDNTQRAILNWYGGAETYKHIPFWQLVKAYKENDYKFIKDNFENKIIYVGTTAVSLSDVKSAPVESNVSGVEFHTTFLNNILDKNFIKKVDVKVDFLIAIILSFIVGYFVLKTSSVAKTFLILFAVLLSYGIIATYSMMMFNIWLSFILPFIASIITFILIYCEKYLLKSRDLEQTYKLAVTDGLTQLYNHRYFQEQMINNVNNYKRYGSVFSLILIDIDFFKKFNDTYGHQSGDCVLIQVAQILKRNSRTSDIACRYGGEEMSIILTNTAKKEAILTANKICNAVRNNEFTLADGRKTNVTISVGVATVDENGSTPQEMIAYSDKCLYKAKENGRNQVVYEI